MSVDVGIVNYNAGAHLSACVERLLKTSGLGRVYIVDNDSCDGSLERLPADAKRPALVTVIKNDRNYGFAHAVNQFLTQARADLLLILNPDCLVDDGTIPAVCRALEADPAVGMAGCLLQNPDGSEQRGARRRLPDPGSSLKRLVYGRRHAQRGFDLVDTPLPTQPVEVEAVSGAFMLVRRAALVQVGPMDEGYFLHCEDLDWCMRFRQAGWNVLFVPDAVATHYQGTSSRGRPVFVLWHKHLGMWRFYRKFYCARYPLPFNVLVWLGIGAHFSLLLPAALISRLRYRSP